LPPIIWEIIEGGKIGHNIADRTQVLIADFFLLGIKRIEEECNKVSSKYLSLWEAMPSTDLLKEYHLNITYQDGCRELKPTFQLFEPSSIRSRIFDSCLELRPDTPALIQHSIGDPLNPILLLFLKTLEIKNSGIFWKGTSITFESIVNHELLHACGDSPILRQGVIDGVIRHTMVCNEAILNLTGSA
jgi:hypothetical protein